MDPTKYLLRGQYLYLFKTGLIEVFVSSSPQRVVDCHSSLVLVEIGRHHQTALVMAIYIHVWDYHNNTCHNYGIVM